MKKGPRSCNHAKDDHQKYESIHSSESDNRPDKSRVSKDIKIVQSSKDYDYSKGHKKPGEEP